MDLRKLKALLKVLQEYKVTSFEDDKIKLTLSRPEPAQTVLDLPSEIKELSKEDREMIENWSSAPI